MDFRQTENLQTRKTYYYVDGKRVAPQKYQYKIIVCKINGMTENSNHLSVNNGKSRYSFSFN